MFRTKRVKDEYGKHFGCLNTYGKYGTDLDLCSLCRKKVPSSHHVIM